MSRAGTSGTSVATRLAASVVAVSVLSLVVATVVGIATGAKLADDVNDQRLRATVESAAFDVAAELTSLQRAGDAFGQSQQAAAAIDSFTVALASLEQLDRADYDEPAAELIETYNTDYLEPLRTEGRDLALRDLSDGSVAAIYLQYNYAVDIAPIRNPAAIDDAGDGSEWTEIHRVVHPVYRDVANRLELLDLYLVEPGGTVVYSVGKRPDLGTNLVTGPFSGSVLATTFDRVVADPGGGSVASDLRFYNAIPGKAVGVIGAPVSVGSELAGVLLMAYDGSELTDLVTADRTFEEGGLPETGDVYVIGADGVLRSDPRSFIEDPVAHLDASQSEGSITATDRQTIEAAGTTALTQSSVDATRDAGREGDESVTDRQSLTGVDVLSVVAPVESESVDWFVVAEADTAATDGKLDDFQELLIVGAAIFVVLVAFAAVAWANGIVGPIRSISERISRRQRSPEPITVPPESPIEIHHLAARLGTMKDTLSAQQQELSEARSERLDLLRSMLPPGIAARITSGEIQTLEQAPAASVVVVIIVGLADLVQGEADHSYRGLVDQLHAELDDVAGQHGLDRIKVVGDAYFAVCGHDRQYIDHAPRAVAFAVDAERVVAGSEAGTTLDVAAGVHSGAVTTGTAGGARLVYDVWGRTVALAHFLARQSKRGEIRISVETKALLPDSISTTAASDDESFVLIDSEPEVRA